MPPPFNIADTSPAASDLISAFPADEQSNRAEIEEWLTFLSDPATGIIKTAALPTTIVTLAAGTKMLFQQTAAPTGWTKETTHNNKALRLTTGTVTTGGTVAFSTAFASKSVAGTISSTTAGGTNGSTAASGTTGSTTQSGSISSTTATGSISNTAAAGTVNNHTLTTAEIPSHTHSFSDSGTTSSNGNHSHTISAASDEAGFDRAEGSTSAEIGTFSTSTAGAHTHTFSVSGTTGSAGTSGAHNHTFTGTSHGHTFTGNSHGHTFTGNSHTHTFNDGGHTHTFTGISHSHTFTGTAIDLAVQFVDVIIAAKN